MIALPANPSLAHDSVVFGPPQMAVAGADAQEFEVIDINGDDKPDLVWRDSQGNLKYGLQNGIDFDDGLVAHYSFTNGSTTDESASGNDLTNSGAPQTDEVAEQRI
jgi:hypothetical protein